MRTSSRRWTSAAGRSVSLSLLLLAVVAPGSGPALALLPIGEFSTPSDARDVEVVDGLAYVADNASFAIVDVSDPFSPEPLGVVPSLTRARDAEVLGDIAIVADGKVLRIIDVSDPSQPQQISQLPQPAQGATQNLSARADGLVFVGSGSIGLVIVDVSNPLAPQQLGLLDTAGGANDSHPVDDLLYLADGVGGLVIVDVSDPTMPDALGSLPLPTPSVALDVEVADDLAYVAARFGGVFVVDVSDPELPVEVAAIPTSEAWDVEVAGDLLYVADGSGGLRVFDISDPVQPRPLDVIATPQSARDVERIAGVLYLANRFLGVKLFDAQPESEGSLMGDSIVARYDFTGNVDDSSEATVVGAGIEFAGDGALFGGALRVGESIEIGASFVELRFDAPGEAWPEGAVWAFEELDWLEPEAELAGFCASGIPNERVTFTERSLSLDVAGLAPGPDPIRIELVAVAVPEPGSALLAAAVLGVLGALRAARFA